MIEVLVLIISILVPIVLIIVFWQKYLDLLKKKPYIAALLVGLFVGTVATEVYLWESIKKLENGITDIIVTETTDRTQNLKKKTDKPAEYTPKNNSLILYALISQKSLDIAANKYNMGWPWRRDIYGEMIKFFDDVGVKLSVFDILFSEKSVYRTNSESNEDGHFEAKDDDAYFAYTIKNTGKSILGFMFGKQGSKNDIKIKLSKMPKEKLNKLTKIFKVKSDLTKKEKIEKIAHKYYTNKLSKHTSKRMVKYFREYAITLKKDNPTVKLPHFHKVTPPYKNYLGHANYIATVNAKSDIDAKYRRTYLLINYNDRYYPSLSFASYLAYIGFNRKSDKVILNQNNLLVMVNGKEVNNIPLDRHGKLRIKYYGWANKKGTSYDDIFSLMSVITFRDKVKKLSDIYFKEVLTKKVIPSTIPSNKSDFIKSIYQDYPKYKKYYNQIIFKRAPDLLKDFIKKHSLDKKDINKQKVINSIKINLLYKAYKNSVKKHNLSEKELSKFKKGLSKKNKYQEVFSDIRFKQAPDTLKKFIKNLTLDRYEKQVINTDLKGKIVMFASVAPGLLDLRPTPFLEKEAGAHIHVSAIDNLIQRDFITEIPPIWAILLIIFVSVLTSLLTASSSLIRGILTWLALWTIIIVGGILLFTTANIIIDIAIPLFAVFGVFLIDTIIHYLVEQKEKGYIKGAFGQYLSPKVIEIIMDDPSKLALGGQRKIITAFFSDVAGFSTISEKLTPDELVQLLNDYLSDMCDIAEKYDGTVDKFEGDAIIAFWGAPLDEKEHAKLACYTTIEMQLALAELRKLWTEQKRPPLISNMTMRVGLNSGPAVIGNMGSKKRMDYTMMGDTVNLAARLEGANKFYGTHSMISGATYDMAKDHIDVRELDKIQVVGKKVAVMVYELLDKKGQVTGKLAEGIEQYLKAMELYKQQKFVEAVPMFESVFKFIPKDPPARTYIDRCNILKDNPPGADWDGRYVLTAKG